MGCCHDKLSVIEAFRSSVDSIALAAIKDLTFLEGLLKLSYESWVGLVLLIAIAAGRATPYTGGSLPHPCIVGALSVICD